jgi:predicted unusual protein kinase regulating ubiquinone biosynthesis (AarF/ABC1/UbiB family)
MISLKPAHMSRYASIAKLLLKYGHRDVVQQIGLDEAIAQEQSPAQESSGRAGPESFARDLEQLGPTFIKLGQLLSTRADVLPPEYLTALERLQDSVEPLPFEQIEEIIEHELGVRISRAFSEFGALPMI